MLDPVEECGVDGEVHDPEDCASDIFVVVSEMALAREGVDGVGDQGEDEKLNGEAAKVPCEWMRHEATTYWQSSSHRVLRGGM